MRHTSPDRIYRHQLALPSIEEQRLITATLRPIDDKIESNHRAITLSEELGDQIFSSRAASSSKLQGIGNLTMGSSPPGSTYNEAGVGTPFYQGVRDFGQRTPSKRVWTTGGLRFADVDDTLISVRAPVGRLNRAKERCCLGRGLAGLQSKYPSLTYYALRAAKDVWLPFESEGTVFGAINTLDLAKSIIPWPPEVDKSSLELALATIDSKIDQLGREIAYLNSLRRELISGLVSGRIRLSTSRGD